MKKTVTTNGETCLWLTGEVVDNGKLWVYEWLDIEAFSADQVIQELIAAAGAPLTLKINSPGGNLVAAAGIYTELMDYAGRITFEITAWAASAASVIAMASAKEGNVCRMSPAALMMIHNVQTVTAGDYRDMDKSAEQLRSANRAIIAAYKLKTGLPEAEIQQLLDKETFFSAQEALEKGLVDEILFEGDKAPEPALQNLLKGSLRAMYNSLPRLSPEAVSKIRQMAAEKQPAPEPEPESLDTALEREMLNIEKIRFGG